MSELTVIQRAQVALGAAEHEKSLRELASKHTALTVITNKAGYEDAQSARMELKTARVDLEKKGKAARDDANAFSKAVIAEEKRLVEIISPEETRLQTLQDAWNAKVEAERQAVLKAEEDRKAALQAKVSAINEMGYAGATAAEITMQGKILHEMQIGEDFQEFANDARNVRQIAINTLTKRLAERQAFEAEQVRIAAEREELAKLRAESEARAKVEREAKAKADAEADEKRRQEDARLAAERQALEAERVKLEEARKAAEPKPTPLSYPAFTPKPAPTTAPESESVIPAIVDILETLSQPDQLQVLNFAANLKARKAA